MPVASNGLEQVLKQDQVLAYVVVVIVFQTQFDQLK